MSDDKPAAGHVRLYNKGSRHIQVGGDIFPPKTTGEFTEAQGAYLKRLYKHELVNPTEAVKSFVSAPINTGVSKPNARPQQAQNPAIAAKAAAKAGVLNIPPAPAAPATPPKAAAPAPAQNKARAPQPPAAPAQGTGTSPGASNPVPSATDAGAP